MREDSHLKSRFLAVFLQRGFHSGFSCLSILTPFESTDSWQECELVVVVSLFAGDMWALSDTWHLWHAPLLPMPTLVWTIFSR